MPATRPTSFRLAPETLAQLDRLATLLTTRRGGHLGAEAGLTVVPTHRPVTRSEALSVAIATALSRIEREIRASDGSRPYGAAAKAGRGALAGLGTGSTVAELLAERRTEAAAEEAASPGGERAG